MRGSLCFSCCTSCCGCIPRRCAVSPVTAPSRTHAGYRVPGCLVSMLRASRVRHARNTRNRATARGSRATGGATGETRLPRARLSTFFSSKREKGRRVKRLDPTPLMGPSTASMIVGTFGRVGALANGVGNSPVFSPVAGWLVRHGRAGACTRRHRPGSDGPSITQGG